MTGDNSSTIETASRASSRRPGARPLPRVSAIIVTWNRRDLVLAAIESLLNCDYPRERLEIIVVDNGSTDGSREILRRRPEVRLICLEANPGPSAARNAGLAHASGDYLLLLDSDARLVPRGLRRSIEILNADPSIAIAGLRILNHHGNVDQWIYAEPYATQGRRMFDTYSFSAAGAILRTSAIRAARGFWEELFIYNEEVDLSIRLIRDGLRVIYLPTATVLHQPAPQGRSGLGLYFRYQIRNWIWIFLRHYPPLRSWAMIGLYSAIYLVKGAVNGRPISCLRGIAEGLTGYRIARRDVARLTPAQARHLRSLNRRWLIRLWGFGAAHGAKITHGEAPFAAPEIDDADAIALP